MDSSRGILVVSSNRLLQLLDLERFLRFFLQLLECAGKQGIVALDFAIFEEEAAPADQSLFIAMNGVVMSGMKT